MNVRDVADPAAVLAEQPYESLSQERERSPVPTPRGPWIMGQRWEDLLFVSWPVPVEALEPHVPAGLEIETADGSAWISAVPFWMSDAHFRHLPPIPFLSSFPEVNLRTYVRCGEHKAVWFLSLDTQSHINVFIARHAFNLPYFYADVAMARGEEIVFRSERPGGGSRFEVRYRPVGADHVPAEGSIEHFLTERYSMACVDEDGDLYRGDIQHAPWRLQQVEWSAASMDLVSDAGFMTDREPLVFYSRMTEVALWKPVRV
jgi:uncharacterized protein